MPAKAMRLSDGLNTPFGVGREPGVHMPWDVDFRYDTDTPLMGIVNE